MMSYEEVISFLYAQLPVFHREGKKAYKPGLGNIEQLAEQLGNPHQAFKSLHIAGTNGKGSSSHFMASILQAHGYRVGLYTSPHLKSFTERIKINGQEVPKSWIVDFFLTYQPLLAEIRPSFFEWTVIMAFQYFKEQGVDYAIIETGLGGRLDSTNIIQPLGCLITNIGYDHQDILGDSLEMIAAEKAGIIKSNIPICISEKQVNTTAIFEVKSKATNSPIRFASDEVTIITQKPVQRGMDLSLQTNIWGILECQSPYGGIYQAHNLVGVVAWCEQLADLNIIPFNSENILDGIKDCRTNTNLRGRWEVYQENPWIVADTAHNESGIRMVLEQVAQYNPQNLTIVLGMVADKDLPRVLALFPKDANYIFTSSHNPRALKAEELKNLAQMHGLQGTLSLDVNEAIQLAKESHADFILVTGSTYLVAEIDDSF
ncbi:MAG: Dihydrofolate synthase [Bacteroidota bacterium]|jgi:dihydrofolate synthase/folylpolyglutamate synthase